MIELPLGEEGKGYEVSGPERPPETSDTKVSGMQQYETVLPRRETGS